MQTFDKPTNLNGAELKDELAAASILVDEIFDYSDGTIGFETDNKTEAAKIVAKHNGTITTAQPSIEEKLATVGLDLGQLKLALGI
jgi:hypothetical protein